MNPPLSTTFPPRVLHRPPTSGGFYGYSKNISREVDEDSNDLEGKSAILLGKEVIKPAAGNFRQFFKAQLYPDDDKKIELRTDHLSTKRKSPQTEDEIEFNHFERKRVAPGLITSFSALMPPRKQDKYGTPAETQTELALHKQKFEGLNDYQVWVQGEVDPLLAELRRAILNERPADIRAFLVAFGINGLPAGSGTSISSVDPKLLPKYKIVLPSGRETIQNEPSFVV